MFNSVIKLGFRHRFRHVITVGFRIGIITVNRPRIRTEFRSGIRFMIISGFIPAFRPGVGPKVHPGIRPGLDLGLNQGLKV